MGQQEHTKNRGLSHVLRKGKQFLFHMWHPSYYSCCREHMYWMWLHSLCLFKTGIWFCSI